MHHSKIPKIQIIIPARYGSTRFPGKPLVEILGIPMVERVWQTTCLVQKKYPFVNAVVATDDQRIADFCTSKNITYCMTDISCQSGTERSLQAANMQSEKPDFVINLQGDNPLCPPWFVEQMIEKYLENPTVEVISPYVNLTWSDLDTFRTHKKILHFSGTTVITSTQDKAIWFSKQIIPAIRHEKKLRLTSSISPVKRHIGLYGYRYDTLVSIQKLPDSHYGTLEGLEQLAFLEAGIEMQMFCVDYKDREGMSGVDSPEDLIVAEHIFKKYGEFSQYY